MKRAIIELPTYWEPDDYDSEYFESLGISKPSIEPQKGTIYVIVENIVAFNEASNPEHTMIRLADSQIYTILMPVNEFITVLKAIK